MFSRQIKHKALWYASTSPVIPADPIVAEAQGGFGKVYRGTLQVKCFCFITFLSVHQSFVLVCFSYFLLLCLHMTGEWM